MDRLPTDAPFTYFFREKSRQKSFLQSCALPLARREGKRTTKAHPSPEVQSVGADVLIGPNWALPGQAAYVQRSCHQILDQAGACVPEARRTGHSNFVRRMKFPGPQAGVSRKRGPGGRRHGGPGGQAASPIAASPSGSLVPF